MLLKLLLIWWCGWSPFLPSFASYSYCQSVTVPLLLDAKNEIVVKYGCNTPRNICYLTRERERDQQQRATTHIVHTHTQIQHSFVRSPAAVSFKVWRRRRRFLVESGGRRGFFVCPNSLVVVVVVVSVGGERRHYE